MKIENKPIPPATWNPHWPDVDHLLHRSKGAATEADFPSQRHSAEVRRNVAA
jgi:hypothetical protein